jgi:phospholipid/cholesterol/gamma-HCH transport system substrate-binding protein
MVGKAQKVRLGIFITVMSLLFIMAVIFIAGDKLMERWDYYYITFSDVSVNGLQVGGQVRYNGIEIGKVDGIRISTDDITQVIVKISVTEGTPIKADVKAHLVLVGITGLKIVELSGGTNEALLLEPGSQIEPGVSLLDNITGKAEVMAEKLEMIMNNILVLTDEENQLKFASILASLDHILIDNRQPVNNVIVNLDSTTAELTQMLQTTNEMLFRINDIVQSAKVDTMIDNFTSISSQMAGLQLHEMVTELNNTIRQVNQTARKIDLTFVRSQVNITETIESLREAAYYLEDFSQRISEDPTLLLRSRSN